jgi:hypothetical protein
MREQVRAVMRYAGPRMLWRHPILALEHLWDGLFRGHGVRPRPTLRQKTRRTGESPTNANLDACGQDLPIPE